MKVLIGVADLPLSKGDYLKGGPHQVKALQAIKKPRFPEKESLPQDTASKDSFKMAEE